VPFFQGFYCEKGDGSNVVASFYGGGDVKKGASDFIFCYWSLWFSLLKYIINNIMVVFVFRLKVIMVRRRRLRKSDGGDLEVHKQNVISSYQAFAEETVVSSNPLQIVIFHIKQLLSKLLFLQINQLVKKMLLHQN
jgi:hypothetical protein